MSIGLGIALIVIGAIFAFAVEVSIPGLDGSAFGWILILAGLLVTVLSLVMSNTARRRRSVAVTDHSNGTQTVTERRTETGGPAGL